MLAQNGIAVLIILFSTNKFLPAFLYYKFVHALGIIKIIKKCTQKIDLKLNEHFSGKSTALKQT